MTSNGDGPNGLNFKVDKEDLYREESITDLKTANIQKLTPVNLDGTVDEKREPVFIGRTQLNTPQGPVPIQAVLEAISLEDAIDKFPAAMELETQKVVEAFKKMQAQQKKQQDSRIIVPGMN